MDHDDSDARDTPPSLSCIAPPAFLPVADGLLPRRRRPHRAVQLAARPAARAARSSCASRTPTRSATARSGSSASTTPCAGSVSSGTSTTASPSGSSCMQGGGREACRVGSRLLLRVHARGRPGADEGQPDTGLRQLLRDRGLGPAPGRRAALPHAGRGQHDGHRRRSRRARLREPHHRGLRAAARRRLAVVHPRQRRRRHGHGHHPCRPLRGAPPEHAEVHPVVGGAGRSPTCPCSPTCPSSSTRSARSSRSGATATGRAGEVPGARATSPRRCATTSRSLGGRRAATASSSPSTR